VQTAGYDPALLSGYSFLGLPVWLTGSPADTVVAFTLNEQVLINNLTPYASSVTYFPTTGDHPDPSNFAAPSQTSLLANLTNWLGVVAPTAPANLAISGTTINATLASGTVTVSDSNITTSSRITVTNNPSGYSGTVGLPYVSAQSSGSVTISDSSTLSTSNCPVSILIEN
jgi:hypothetical protein